MHMSIARSMWVSVAVVGVAAVLFAFALPVYAGGGAGQPNEHANCLGVERATRNSAGGDRAHGGFGPAQASFVQTKDAYGMWLQGWNGSCLHS